MNSVILFQHQDHSIRITITAFFEGEFLVVEGYDIGAKVKEYWGDSDYEYEFRVGPKGVEMLCRHFGLAAQSKDALLEALQSRYHTNTCYSEIRKLLDQLGIEHEGSSWV